MLTSPGPFDYVYKSSMHEQCVTLLLLACSPGWPIKHGKFPLARSAGIPASQYRYSQFNKLLLLCFEQTCVKTLIQINSDSCTNVFSRGVNKPTTQQTSHANDFVNVKSHARNKPPISSQSIFFLKLMLSWCRISVSPGRKESTLFLKLTFLFAFRRLVSMVLLVTSISKNDRPFTR